MKKICQLLLLCLVVVSSSSAFADKATSYTSCRGEVIKLTFNVQKWVDGEVHYIPIFAQMTGKAVTSDTPKGGREVYQAVEIGEVTDTKKTKEELKVLLGKSELKALYAAFYLDALNEVID